MDDKWRVMTCPLCRGYTVTWNPLAWDGTEECCNGSVYLRPKGHAFEWPGGPANGNWGPGYYEKATPVMPFQWHCWTNKEKEIEEFIVDRNGSLDGNLNIVTCACGFIGTIKEHDEHSEIMKQEFIEAHSRPAGEAV